MLTSRRRSTALSAVLLIALAGCKAETEVPAAPPPTVSVSHPIQREVTGWDTFTGRLDAVDMVEIRPRVSGYVERVVFRDGDFVHKGDLLFEIDPRPYEAAVIQADGQLAQARSKAMLAHKDYERAKLLITTQAISDNVLDQRRQGQQVAEAVVKIATGVLSRVQLDLEFTKVYAPIDGRISRKLVGAGNLVAGGDGNATLLTTIVSLDTIDAYFDVDEESYLRYGRLVQDGKRSTPADLGGEVRIALPGDAEPSFEGQLNFAENRLDASTGTLRVRARISNPSHVLNPGQFVRVSIVGEAPHAAVLVPDAAVTSDAGQQVLYLVNSDDKVVARPVTLGRLFGVFREVTNGLEISDRVVISGLQRAQPGAKVTVELKRIDSKQLALVGDQS